MRRIYRIINTHWSVCNSKTKSYSHPFSFKTFDINRPKSQSLSHPLLLLPAAQFHNRNDLDRLPRLSMSNMPAHSRLNSSRSHMHMRPNRPSCFPGTYSPPRSASGTSIAKPLRYYAIAEFFYPQFSLRIFNYTILLYWMKNTMKQCRNGVFVWGIKIAADVWSDSSQAFRRVT